MLELIVFRVVSAFVLFLSFTSSSVAQEDLYAHKSNIDLSFNLNGRVELTESTRLDWKPPYDSFELLKSSEIRQELELLPDQIKKIESLYSGFENMRVDIRKRLRAGDREVAKEYENACEQLQDDIDEVLLDPQRDRLTELNWQIVLRTVGIDRLLEEYLKSTRRSFTRSQFGVIQRNVQQLVSKWAIEIESKTRQALAEFESEVPEELRGQFSKEVEANAQFLNLDVVDIASRRVLEKLRMSEKETDQDAVKDELMDRLRRFEGYNLQADGQWKYYSGSRSVEGALLSWIYNPDISGILDLELTDGQRAQVAELSAQIQARIEEKNQAVTQMYEENVGEGQIGKFLDERNKSNAELAEKTMFEEILVSSQLTDLGAKLDRIETSKLGPFHLLVEHKLTDRQHSKTIAAVEKLITAIRDLQSEGSEFERKLIKDSLESVDSEAADGLLKLIGKEPKYLFFSLVLFQKVYRLPSNVGGTQSLMDRR